MAIKATLLAFSAFSGLSLAVFQFLQRVQPTPYMDEVFHIPQAQKYCSGRFREWDPKITTLPGLYLISVGVLHPLSRGLERWVCETAHLRMINVGLASLTLIILHRITEQIHGGKHYYDPNKALLSSLNMCLFPLFYFFSFLYYTDVGSTFLVIFMYSLHLNGNDWWASFIGLLAVSFRQTNIIWVAFVACQRLGPLLVHHIHMHMLEGPHPVKINLDTRGKAVELLEGIYFLLFDPRRLWKVIQQALPHIGGYLMILMAFVSFIILNEGIVVGDREAHVASFHPTQVLYFAAFSLGLAWPFFLPLLPAFLTFVRRHYRAIIFQAILCYCIVDVYSLAHPYLLADNRHYTFYIWRRLLDRTPWSKFIPIPLYIFGTFGVLHSLKRTHIIFKVSYPLFVIVSLTPQLLLEFRYFIIPYLFFRIQVPPTSWLRLWAELAFFICINAVTIYLFVQKPFEWEHDPGEVQRFMW